MHAVKMIHKYTTDDGQKRIPPEEGKHKKNWHKKVM